MKQIINKHSIAKKLELLSRLSKAINIGDHETVAISVTPFELNVHLSSSGFLRLLNSRLRSHKLPLTSFAECHCHFMSGPFRFTTIASDSAETDRAVLLHFRSQR